MENEGLVSFVNNWLEKKATSIASKKEFGDDIIKDQRARSVYNEKIEKCLEYLVENGLISYANCNKNVEDFTDSINRFFAAVIGKSGAQSFSYRLMHSAPGKNITSDDVLRIIDKFLVSKNWHNLTLINEILGAYQNPSGATTDENYVAGCVINEFKKYAAKVLGKVSFGNDDISSIMNIEQNTIISEMLKTYVENEYLNPNGGGFNWDDISNDVSARNTLSYKPFEIEQCKQYVKGVGRYYGGKIDSAVTGVCKALDVYMKNMRSSMNESKYNSPLKDFLGKEMVFHGNGGTTSIEVTDFDETDSVYIFVDSDEKDDCPREIHVKKDKDTLRRLMYDLRNGVEANFYAAGNNRTPKYHGFATLNW